MAKTSDKASVRELQQQLGTALLSLKGHGVLDNDTVWAEFIASDAGKLLSGVSRERLYLYEELIRGSIYSTMSSIFPYTCRFFSNNEWIDAAELFRRSYPNVSFQLFRSMEGFPEFMEGHAKAGDYPFLADLAWYEGLEVTVQTAPNESPGDGFEPGIPDSVEELGDWKPVWNVARELKMFTYPVPEIIAQLDETGDDEIGVLKNVQPAPSEILIYRDPETLLARFFRLNPLTSQFMRTSEKAASYLETLEILQAEVAGLDTIPREKLLQEGLKLINQCHELGILLGSRKA